MYRWISLPALSIEHNSKADSRNMCLIIIFNEDYATDVPPNLSEVRWAVGCAASSHTSLTITTCFLISHLKHHHSISLLRMCLLRKQFSLWLPKQTEALLHTFQRDPSISQISMRLDWVFDRSFDCHSMSMGVRVRICWRIRNSVLWLEIILVYTSIAMESVHVLLFVLRYPQ